MTTTITPPSDSDVRLSVDRVAAELFTRLQYDRRAPSRRKKFLFGIGALILAAGLVGGTGAVAGIWILPGSPVDVELSEWQTLDGTGPSVVDLGAPPAAATWLSIRFTCLSAGSFSFDIGGDSAVSTDCFDSDVPRTSSGSPTFALEPGSTRLTVTATGGAKWSVDYRFVDRTFTPWAINANGQTYGVPNEEGIPELEAITDAEGNIAYVYTSEQFLMQPPLSATATPEEAAAYDAQYGPNSHRVLNAYDSDGVTIIGEWILGNDGGLHLFD